MASYSKGKNGLWKVQFYSRDYLGNNKKYSKSSFKTKKDAEKYYLDFTLKQSRKTNQTIKKALEIFLMEKLETVKYSTYKKYENDITKQLTGLLNLTIDDITPLMLKQYCYEIKETKKYNNRVVMLKIFFKWCMLYYALEEDKTKFLKVIPLRKNKKDIITIEEFKNLLEIEENKKYKCIYSILFYGGLRIGELLALTNKDIDLINSRIRINKTVTQYNTIQTPKTLSSERYINLPLNVMNLLKEQVEKSKSKRIFNIGIAMINKRLKEKFSQVNENKKITSHCFRHSHTSILLKNNIDIATVSRRLGHSNSQITLSTYTHYLEDEEDKVINFLENI